MKFKKKIFFKIHSWIGIRLSILFFIVCFSGTLATLSYEIDWLFNTDIRVVPQAEFVSRNVIVKNFKIKYPNARIGFWERTKEGYICDVIQKMENGQRTYIFANPHTGEIQGEANLTAKRFFRDLHYFLFIPFQVGNFLVLFFGFLMLISLVTALVFYKKWWRKLFELQTGKGTLVFFRSLHRLVGLWSVPFTLLFAITGIWYFMERANVGGLGREVNPRSPKVLAVSEHSLENQNLSYTVDYERAVAIAEKEIPGMVVGNVLPPQNKTDDFYLVGNSNVPLVRQRANRVYLNPYTYEVIGSQKANEITTKMWLNDIADPFHFGYWGGLITKIIWFFMGLGITSLVFSGIWITAKRLAIKRKNKQKKVMGVWRGINWGIYALMMFFMYYVIIDRYRASVTALTVISLGWSLFIILAYYIFVYRLNKIVRKST